MPRTTLLNILAGRVRRKKRDKKTRLSGDVTYGGRPFHDGGRGGAADGVSLAYIEQDPRFFSNLTVGWDGSKLI